MRKLFFPLLSLRLLTTAREDSVPSPIIEMEGLYIDDGEMGYARQMEALPPLRIDDELEISLKLDGSGEKLNTFLVKEEALDSEVNAVVVDFNELSGEVLSDGKEFTDKDSGKLGFKDGVSQTKVGLWVKVQQVTEDGAKLKFYLSPKPVSCKGAKYKLETETSEDQTDQLGGPIYKKNDASNNIALFIYR